MMHAVLADAVLVLHAAFVVFVIAGGLLALRWPRVAWVHVPAAAWGALVELAGWICPLTPLEDALRAGGSTTGGAGEADFLERLLLPLLYPDWLTREVQIGLGLAVILLNVAVYSTLIARVRRARRPPGLAR
jgi:hypothetical protein